MPLTRRIHQDCRCGEVWSIKEQIDAKLLVIANLICEVRQLKEQYPEHRLGFQLSGGGILNAYREGDVSFDEAVRRISELQPEMST